MIEIYEPPDDVLIRGAEPLERRVNRYELSLMALTYLLVLLTPLSQWFSIGWLRPLAIIEAVLAIACIGVRLFFPWRPSLIRLSFLITILILISFFLEPNGMIR